MKIIDFHVHPFIDDANNICSHKGCFTMDAAYTKSLMQELGVSRFCGSVLGRAAEGQDTWQMISHLNEEALKLATIYGDMYVPGYHVHPDHVKESCEQIERMSAVGVKLIGELVPYMHGWSEYACEKFTQILDVAGRHDAVVSFHSMNEDGMDEMVRKHKNITFVAAHPGEYREFMRHMERMKYSDNYYLELSGYGMFRHGMLRHGIDKFGAHRFLFGSDYPTCNPAMYIGGVMLDPHISDTEKEMIMYKNAERILKLP